jgi:glycosyltransferase involved in cell wall biosynthesis
MIFPLTALRNPTGTDTGTARIELTILMPCLNEAETIGACITKASSYLLRSQICGEILIADNGSTDGSQEIAKRLGARVVSISKRGYGAALTSGIEAAKGRFVIMGDADDSYDFSRLDEFVAKLREGYDLVM